MSSATSQSEDTAASWPRRPESGAAPSDFGVIWEGSQFLTHSLAIVNQALCTGLIKRGLDLGLKLYEEHEFTAGENAELKLLEERFERQPQKPVAIHVRHQWPPVFERPDNGKWVMIQPWEYGFVPKDWREPMTHEVDEIWVPTRYARQCYIDSGIPQSKIFVIPNGVDTDRFNPNVAPAQLQTSKSFKFLFVGGTIPRKGIKLLLETYTRYFKREDDVCLVIKDLGRKGVYRGSTSHEEIERIMADPNAPEIEYIDQNLPHDKIAGLYRAADVLVHPYHGEGFGMPISEAMSCGIPAIVTGLGAATDFCNQQNSYLISATRHDMPTRQVSDLEACGFPWIANPDPDAFGLLMREAVLKPADRIQKGRAARETIVNEFQWDHAVDCVIERLIALAEPREPEPLAPESGEYVTKVRAAGEEMLMSMIEREEGGMDSYARLADLLYRDGRIDEAADILASALKVEPNSRAIRQRATALLNQTT